MTATAVAGSVGVAVCIAERGREQSGSECVRIRKDLFLHRGLWQGIRLSRYRSTRGGSEIAGDRKMVRGDGGHGLAERPVGRGRLLSLARHASVRGFLPSGPWIRPSRVASGQFQRS
jgi:hypothetical protein